MKSNNGLLGLVIAEDCFTPWLIHDEGEFIFIIFKKNKNLKIENYK